MINNFLQSSSKVSATVLKFDKDLDLFLSKVMPEMIVSPKEFKTVNVLDEDFTAKQLLAAALIEVETKKLKSQQKRKTLRITEN